MKKASKLFNYSCLILIVLMSSCSHVRYTYLNKTPRGNQVIEPRFVINELKEKENAALSSLITGRTEELVKNECNERVVDHAAPKLNLVEGNEKEKGIAPLLIKGVATKVLAKLPTKLKEVFSVKKNTVNVNQMSEFSIFWAIIAALVVFWLLGWALSGSGLVHILIVVAIVLVLLRLIGLI